MSEFQTATAVILLVAALLLWRTATLLLGKGSAGGVRTYRSEAVVQRGVVRTMEDLEADMLHLWRLRCAGKAASRRAVVRRGEMTHYRWTDAAQRLERLKLVAGRDSYQEGAARIRAYVEEHRRLAAVSTYVEP